MAAANYIIKIIRKRPAQTVVLHSALPVLSLSKGSAAHKSNTIFAYNLRLCKMLSLQTGIALFAPAL